jgi:hypothetical protein
MREYWFDITGKVYARTKKEAEELVYRYTLGAYPDIKIDGYEMEEDIEKETEDIHRT